MISETTNENTLGPTPARPKNALLPGVLIAVIATAPIWTSRVSSTAQSMTKLYGEVPAAAAGALALLAGLGLGVIYARQALRPEQRTFDALLLALAAILLLTLGVSLMVPLAL